MFNSKYKVVKIEVVLEYTGVGENGAKTRATQKYFPTYPRTKLWRRCL